VRGTDPDAALYWFAHMLDGGCDPHYLARRIVRMAVEDIGLADPRGQQLALDAWQTFERLGSPEGELALANALVYLAVAPKSNAVYVAYGEARADVEQFGTLDVPLRFRNAPTRLMKGLGCGEDCQYAHDAPDAFVKGGAIFPTRCPTGVTTARGAGSRSRSAKHWHACGNPQRARRSGPVGIGGALGASRDTARIACGRCRRAGGPCPLSR
jgi:replication-associated recombination protein RarA